MESERIIVREQLYREATKIADVYDRILSRIHKSESSAQALKSLRKLKDAMQEFEQRNFMIGRYN